MPRCNQPRIFLTLLLCAITLILTRAHSADRISSANFPSDKRKAEQVSPETAKAPEPPADKRAEANKVVAELFQKDLAKKSASERLVAAQKLADQALLTKDDDAGRYVLLYQAALVSAQAGDAQKFIAFRARLLAAFNVSAPALAELNKAAFDALAIGATKDAALSKFIAALRTLDTSPSDPAANLSAGSYMAFTLDEWGSGLPLLANSAQPALKTLATKELAGAKEPIDQMALGDAWWEAAEKADKTEKRAYQKRAAHWFDLALPGLTGLNRAKAETRIRNVEASAPPEKPKEAKLPASQPLTMEMLDGKALNPGVYSIEGVLKLTGKIDNTVVIPAGTIVLGGTILFSRSPKLRAEGTAADPVVFRNVEFRAEDIGQFFAFFSVFESCRFVSIDSRISNATLQLAANNSLFNKCTFTGGVPKTNQTAVAEIEYALSDCVLVNSTLTEIDGSVNDRQRALPNGARFLYNSVRICCCTFIGSPIPSSVFWLTTSCNYINCTFSAKPVNLTGWHGPEVPVHFANCAGSPTGTPMGKIIPAAKPYPIAAMPPVPELPELQPVYAQIRKLHSDYKWLSRNAVYTVSSVSNGAVPSPKLLTGEGMQYDNSSNFYTKSPDPQDIIIDLSRAETVTAVEMIRDSRFIFEGEPTVFTSTEAEGPWAQQWQGTVRRSVAFAEFKQPVTCRYIKIVGKTGEIPKDSHSGGGVAGMYLSFVRVFGK